DHHVAEVAVRVGGATYELKPKYTVICAGTGNSDVLERLGVEGDTQRSGMPVQAMRKNHMVVLRGNSLPRMTAVFPIRGGCRGVFLCSRTDPATGATVWLVADHHSTPFVEGSDSEPSPEIVAKIVTSLLAVAPGV